jgi:hypothetical protein
MYHAVATSIEFVLKYRNRPIGFLLFFQLIRYKHFQQPTTTTNSNLINSSSPQSNGWFIDSSFKYSP